MTNVIGLIRIFPFWAVDPERLRCRAEPCKEKRGTPFSLSKLARFAVSILNCFPLGGAVAAVMDFRAVAHRFANQFGGDSLAV